METRNTLNPTPFPLQQRHLGPQEETNDVQGVMDGDLDAFIQALLRQGVDSPGQDEDS